MTSFLVQKAPKAEFRPVEFSGPHANLLLEPNKFHGITRDISYRQIRLSNLSVNSVIINTADNPSPRRMLVSSAVSAAEAGDHLYLEDSTLLPAVPGFNDLVILLFAPNITFLVNDKDKVLYETSVPLRIRSNPILSWANKICKIVILSGAPFRPVTMKTCAT